MIRIQVDSHDLADLYRAAKAAPGVVQVELRRGVKKAAQPVADSVKSAASWSSRIPGSIKTKASFAAKGASVTIVADAGIAPEAAPLNHGGKGGTFRHRVFGGDTWVSQPARPFFQTGAKAGTPAAERAMLDVMDQIARKLGFH
jgi:hypothetical protein